MSVKAHPLCHSVSLPGQSDIRLLSPPLPPFLPFPSISFSFFRSLSVRLLPVFLQRHGSPLIPDPITDSLGTHLSSSNPLVFVMECFANTSAGDSGPIYMWFLSLLLVLLRQRRMPPSPNPFPPPPPFFFPLNFPLRPPPPPPLLTHPSSLYLTGDKVWASS